MYIYIYIYIFILLPRDGGFNERRINPTRPRIPCLLRNSCVGDTLTLNAPLRNEPRREAAPLPFSTFAICDFQCASACLECICVCMRAYAGGGVCMRTCACICVRVRAYACICVCMRTDACVCAHMHA